MAESSHAILMVDDDVELCALVAEYLGGHGYHVATVHDGASGLRAALEGRHDLVVLDLMLPLNEAADAIVFWGPRGTLERI